MFEVGNKVRVEYPPLNGVLASGMFKYNHKVTKVLDVIHYAGYNQNSYLLEGCTSPTGAFYEFIDEWLVGAESEVSNESASESD